jgi:hypothetical protein
MGLLPWSLLACSSSLWGDNGRVEYYTDLGYNFVPSGFCTPPGVPWQSGQPVASGTTWSLSAVGWVDSSGVAHDYGPVATATSEDTGVLAVTGETDSWTLQALQPGEARLDFDGDADDTLHVVVEAPLAFGVINPVVPTAHYLLQNVEGFDVLAGEVPSPEEFGVRVDEGATGQLVWPVLVGESATPLSFDDAELVVVGTPSSAVFQSGEDILLDSTATALTATLGETAFPPVEFMPVPEEQIASVDLVVLDPGVGQGYGNADLILWAVVRASDGQQVIGAYVDWSIPDEFSSSYEIPGVSGPGTVRTDMRSVTLTNGTPDFYQHTFGVSLNGHTDEETVSWEWRETQFHSAPATDSDGGGSSPSGGCLCAASTAAPALWSLAALGGILIRRRRSASPGA